MTIKTDILNINPIQATINWMGKWDDAQTHPRFSSDLLVSSNFVYSTNQRPILKIENDSTLMQSEGDASKQKKSSTPFDHGLQMKLLSPADFERNEIEQFIKNGYIKHFGANLNKFSPIILAVIDFKTGRILGAVGLRYADSQPLFSENYLTDSIESLLAEMSKQSVRRKDIIELSHFVVDQGSDVNVVITLVGQFLKSLDVTWAVYTLSRPIKLAFQRLGIQLTHIQHAHPDALKNSTTDWGRYYDFKPAVYCSNILKNMNQ